MSNFGGDTYFCCVASGTYMHLVIGEEWRIYHYSETGYGFSNQEYRGLSERASSQELGCGRPFVPYLDWLLPFR